MDSMRHLSTSLPPASRRPAPAELLPDFKAAAQAVTTLYRNAATSQKHARQAGYQDALDDLLAFLDRENLGLMDGEGWKVRRWATERLDGDGVAARQQTPPLASGGMTDDEDETIATKEEDKEDEERGSSPEAPRKQHPLAVSSSDLSEPDIQQRRVVSEPPVLAPPSLQQHQPTPRQSDFTFQSTHTYPTNHDRDASTDMEMEATTPPTFTSPSSAEAVRIIPRPSRMSRHGTHNRRAENRGPTLNFNLGAGAGGKRKMPYSEYFDIHGLNDGDRKDGSGGRGGGKRSRQA